MFLFSFFLLSCRGSCPLFDFCSLNQSIAEPIRSRSESWWTASRPGHPIKTKTPSSIHTRALPTAHFGSSSPLKVWFAADEDAELMITFDGLLQPAGQTRAAPGPEPDPNTNGTSSCFPGTFGIWILPAD